MEVNVKKEIQDYDDDDDDEVEIMDMDHDQTVRKVAEFRERLMNEVNRPYCEEECKSLLQHFNLRKPVQSYRSLRLRGVEKIHERNHAKSYHDDYLDLAKQIDAAGDDLPKVLHLLRGFFFWLIHVADEGAFVPWRVPLDLDVLPQH
ncbi:uncharacterized protein LOC131655478 [Vicia villosa]|uniref:uncharacterized protein LOC131655478 n=1 Tax=Vicia villosa TaxID=3911 RepID=UPI00273C59E7|nr:uncharacterized protein LOC131655478 [Vicia villosa]